jgi:hypothetical protein
VAGTTKKDRKLLAEFGSINGAIGGSTGGKQQTWLQLSEEPAEQPARSSRSFASEKVVVSFVIPFRSGNLLQRRGKTLWP